MKLDELIKHQYGRLTLVVNPRSTTVSIVVDPDVVKNMSTIDQGYLLDKIENISDSLRYKSLNESLIAEVKKMVYNLDQHMEQTFEFWRIIHAS